MGTLTNLAIKEEKQPQGAKKIKFKVHLHYSQRV